MTEQQSRGSTGPYEELVLGERVVGVRLGVHVRPRSSKSAIGGVRRGALEVSLTAPPVEGEANAELVKVVARALEVRRGDLSIVAGATGRSKVLEVRGVTAADVRRRLEKAAR